MAANDGLSKGMVVAVLRMSKTIPPVRCGSLQILSGSGKKEDERC